MKAYILKDDDFARLIDIIANHELLLRENGTAEQHRNQVREQLGLAVENWILRVKL